jgi:hypothetical protein
MQASETPLPPLEPVKTGRSCLFYGCLTVSVLTLLVFVAVGIGVYSVYRYATGMLNQYTSTTPMALPRVELSKEQMEDLEKRGEAFLNGAGTGEDHPPLVVTADELNAKMAQNPDLKDHFHVELPGDKIEAQISLPLDKLKIGALKGRYLNGKGTLRVHLLDGNLVVFLETLEVNGKPVPAQVMQAFKGKNLAEEFARDPHNAEELKKIESVEVKESKLVIKARKKLDDEEKKGETPMPAGDEDDAKAKDKEEAKAEKEKAEPKSP